jgi:hypothetical protein
MELTQGVLRAALIAGKIPVTDKALATLRDGLGVIGHGYHLEKVFAGMAKTPTELKKDLSRLHVACRTIVDVLDADLSGLRQISVMLSFPGFSNQVPRLAEELRLLIHRIEMVLALAPPDGPIKKRRQTPTTWFFVAVHDLYCEITADHDPGVAGPLHRFTKHCAALIDARIVVSESENSFQKRLTAALSRRTGKISVLPKIIFPGK